jgi:hypothetical protein
METIDSMKRVIAILAVAIVALGVWSRFSTTKPVTQKSSGDISSKANVSGADKLSPRLRRAMASPENDSTNSADTSNADEESPWKKLSLEQVDAYLQKNKRAAESLLNAYIETGDTNFLAEAAKNFPDNPLVQWEMLNHASPEERSQWLEKLKVSSPNNALPDYLSALDYLKAGNTERALVEMDAASKKNYSSFDLERRQSREEMYLLAGFSPMDAREQGISTLLLPNLSEMKTLAQQISALQQKYLAAGDAASTQQLGALGIEASRKLREGNNPLISQLVGFAMENIALKNLDANTYYDFLGKSAGERLEEIKMQKQEVKDLMPIFTRHYPYLSDTEKMIYLDRSKLYGELNAMRWLKKNYGETK